VKLLLTGGKEVGDGHQKANQNDSPGFSYEVVISRNRKDSTLPTSQLELVLRKSQKEPT
jgi:hypothetical protein